MKEKIIQTKIFQRIIDGFVPFLSWVFITIPFWLSPFHPAVVAYFIITFDLYFFYKSIQTVYMAVSSYKKLLYFSKINFAKKLSFLKKAKEIKHFIIIPNYKEPLTKLESTINSLINNDYTYKKNLYLVLAFEKREKEAKKKSFYLKKKYQRFFKKIIASFHQLVVGEEEGKASNQTYAAKILEKFIKKNSWSLDDIIITIADADSHFSKNYFSYLTYTYLKDKTRRFHFYWAPVILYNNFWQLPIFVRIQATLSSILRLAFLEQKQNLIQISTYSTSFWLLKKINYWDVDIIPEDWHIYLQAFFAFGNKVKTIPLYTIINSDAVYSGNLLKTLFNRYQQEKRWAWGVSDVGYSLKKLFTDNRVNFWTKFKKIIFLAKNHFLWPTSFFVLTLSASIPPIINPVFKKTVLGFILPKLSGLILTLSSLMLVFYFYLDIKLRKQIKQKTKPQLLPFLIIQWYLLPIVSFFLSSLPALEAHTRLLLGKKIKYKVTEKV
ncbi:MAG: glycosyltransferase family 2 protein [Patescibacteria group bacterium]|nr:glycosyltransferase family 2 protein [Patescibacteria group bacterium]